MKIKITKANGVITLEGRARKSSKPAAFEFNLDAFKSFLEVLKTASECDSFELSWETD